MYEIVEKIVKSGNAEELNKIIKQYELDVSKRKENKKNERI
jgi:hypothetical protein